MKFNDEAVRQLLKFITLPPERPKLTPAEIAELCLFFPLGFIWPLVPATFGMIEIASRNRAWNHVRARVEYMVNQKIQAYHLKILDRARKGHQDNMVFFRSAWETFNNATSKTHKRDGSPLLSYYTAFTMTLQKDMHLFKIEGHEVASFLDFTAAADLYISMLALGIAHGQSWGFPQWYIDSVRSLYNDVTGSGTRVPAVLLDGSSSSKNRVLAALRQGGSSSNNTVFSTRTKEASKSTALSRRNDDAMRMQLLSGAIEKGESEGVSADLLKTWKDTYSAFSVPRHDNLAVRGEGGSEDYPTYLRKTYERGRKMVRPEKRRKERGDAKLANELRTYADYDALMVMHGLSYTEYWPYLTGEFEVPDSVFLNLDREIFSGPFGRSGPLTPWNATREPPVTARTHNITSITLRTQTNKGGTQVFDGVQAKSAGRLGMRLGSSADGNGTPHRIDLAPNEFIQNVDLSWSKKIRSLAFDTYNYETNSTGSYGPFGTPPKSLRRFMAAGINATAGLAVNRTGYGLSSISCTSWSQKAPFGCEGVVFGWRPLYFAADTYTGGTPALDNLKTFD